MYELSTTELDLVAGGHHRSSALLSISNSFNVGGTSIGGSVTVTSGAASTGGDSSNTVLIGSSGGLNVNLGLLMPS